MTHGWQSESTDGPKGGWSCAFGVVAMVAALTSLTAPGCSAVWRSSCSCSRTCSVVEAVEVVAVLVVVVVVWCN